MNWFHHHLIDQRLDLEHDDDIRRAVNDALDAIDANPKDPAGVHTHTFRLDRPSGARVAWLPHGYFLVYEHRAQAPIPHAGECIMVRRFAHLHDLTPPDDD